MGPHVYIVWHILYFSYLSSDMCKFSRIPQVLWDVQNFGMILWLHLGQEWNCTSIKFESSECHHIWKFWMKNIEMDIWYSPKVVTAESHFGEPGGKMLSYQYGDPHVKDKTVCNRLIFNMGIPKPGEDGLYIEIRPRLIVDVKHMLGNRIIRMFYR